MTYKNIVTINGIVLLIFGLGFLFLANTMLSIYGGAELGEEGLVTARFLGGVMLGNVILMFLMREEGGTKAGRVIAITQAFNWFVAVIVEMLAISAGLFNTLMWSNVAIGVLLFLGFGYLVRQERS